MAVKFRYVGEGHFLPGIPARDLTDEDVEALTSRDREELEINAGREAGRIYEAADAAKGKQQAAPAPSDDAEGGD